MSELRERRPQDTQAALRSLSGGKTASGYQRAPRPPPRPNRTVSIAISIAVFAVIVLLSQRRGRSIPRVYTVESKDLPDLYAICSKEGRNVYTVPAEGDDAGGVECVVVEGKYVVDTGSLAKVRRKYGDATLASSLDQLPVTLRGKGIKIIYLPIDHTLTPGLTDSHGHPLQYGHSLQLPLAGTTSISEVIKRVEDYVQQNGSALPSGAWIEGMGWDQNKWEVKEFPTADDLESSAILRGLPIALARIDVHAQWVSPEILRQLGDLPDHIEGGQIVRDASGNPTGVFIDNAMDLIEAIRPPWTDVQRRNFLEQMMDDALSHGLVGVHDAWVGEDDLRFYQKMAQEEKLRMRFYSMVYCEDRERYCGDSIPKVHNAQDGRLNVKSVKLFADGALGSRGAALLADYSDLPGWRGFLLRPEGQSEPMIRRWYNDGWQVNVHTIGDRANHVVLNAIEAVLKDDPTGGKDRRLRLEHAQILTQEDLARAARLGVIASFQPTHATSDMDYAENRLGPERIQSAYAWKTYLNLGGRITLGSDFPVESIDPLKGFYAAVTRLHEDGSSPHGKGGWYPKEKLSRLEALRGMTVNAAYASFSEETGSLTPGKRFDAVIWDDDLLTVPEDEILEVKTIATIIDGQIAWGQVIA